VAVAEAVAEEVATNLEEIAEVTRRIDGRAVSFLLGGVVLGIPVGFYFGYRWNKEKIRAEAFQQSDEEIEQVKEMFRLRDVARSEKPTVQQVIEERGYSTKSERPLAAPVPISLAPAIPPPVAEPKEDGWDYPYELAQRSPEQPYVIHQDEFKGTESGYSQTTYTYYEVDDVLTNTDDTPVPNGDIVVGQDNLKWGHGTDDPDVVFVRNDKLELEMEICRVPKSYEEEVLGHDRNETN
jgi:hypothetical protein